MFSDGSDLFIGPGGGYQGGDPRYGRSQWISGRALEHKIYYKFEGNAPDYISEDLKECADIVSMLDAKMLSLNKAILEAKKAEQ